jgi:hypothetical protein
VRQAGIAAHGTLNNLISLIASVSFSRAEEECSNAEISCCCSPLLLRFNVMPDIYALNRGYIKQIPPERAFKN